VKPHRLGAQKPRALVAQGTGDLAKIESIESKHGWKKIGKLWEKHMENIWLWINTYENTIFRGMNIHLPAIIKQHHHLERV
jgi:hypothetical protein